MGKVINFVFYFPLFILQSIFGSVAQNVLIELAGDILEAIDEGKDVVSAQASLQKMEETLVLRIGKAVISV